MNPSLITKTRYTFNLSRLPAVGCGGAKEVCATKPTSLTTVVLGGDDGKEVFIEKGDMLVIPAGAAHKNWGDENNIGCVGAYPYDMNYANPGERPKTDENLKRVPIPDADPLARR